ncbi:hypothetical protein NUW58_g9520 [Xylaria curta]|uniref:Uncharacterized protein n=1 Tax=Xylaria curta TaxID=42375 RepID=A0ACC1MW91_9PEZI|nr:hypothetical protein NUW58_g9520 [Xylaria curta]
MPDEPNSSRLVRPWKTLFQKSSDETIDDGRTGEKQLKPIWTMGILNDRETIEVPGSVLLLSNERNEPLGLRNAPARTSHSSFPTGILPEPIEEKKLTKDGQIILEPQPDDSHNDPLNWPAWRRDCALISLGLYCMVGGGITPIIAAGFTDVAHDYDVDVAQVSLTTGLYMLGLGLGCVIFSPTAILYGKRPVYLFSSILFIASAVWCALSPSFTSLILARIFQGIAVSPVECLPSATIAEIFFLHERAFRIGIYTLLLLGGKNLVPLVSAAIINQLDWRWVFWIVAIVVGFCGVLLFFFVPETFWDRTPIPKSSRAGKRPGFFSRRSSAKQAVPTVSQVTSTGAEKPTHEDNRAKTTEENHEVARPKQQRHVGFASDGAFPSTRHRVDNLTLPSTGVAPDVIPSQHDETPARASTPVTNPLADHESPLNLPRSHNYSADIRGSIAPEINPALPADPLTADYPRDPEPQRPAPLTVSSDTDSERMSFSNLAAVTMGQVYTHRLREAPRQSFKSQLKIHNGRINQDVWWRAAVRPFILFSYPAASGPLPSTLAPWAG